MLRSSLTCLLLAVLGLSDHINCADNDTKPNDEVAFATYNDGWITRDIKITEPHSVLLWHGSSPHRQFFYLTWDGKKNYCMVTQVSTDSSSGASKTCQHKFRRNGYVTRIRRLDLPDEGDSMIGIAYTTDRMSSNNYVFDDVNFATCQRYGAPESNATDISSSPAAATAGEEDAKDVKIMQDNSTSLSSSSLDIFSNSNGRLAYCKVNDELTQIVCKQYEKNPYRLVMENVKYDLPTHWKADWFAVHNSKAGAILLYFSDCPNGMCKDYSYVRLTAKGQTGSRFVQQKMNLKCSDKSKLTVDVSDQANGWVCMHAVCPEVTGAETLLQYRRQCSTGDSVA